MPVGEVRIKGLKEFNRALKYVDKGTGKTVRDAFKKAAEPVRARAETLAVAEISHVGLTWSRMRVGSTMSTVYIAPKARRRGGSPRPNLGRRLFEDAMMPALEEKEGEVVREVENALDILGRKAGF